MSTLNKVRQHNINWSSIVLNPVFLAQLDAMASKRFVQQVLAEEAVTSIIESLSENNWQRLQNFSGKSQASTFVYSVAARSMEDFARKKFGRPRPPTWLKERGQVWVKLWRMLCLERQWPELIKAKLQNDFQHGFIEEAIRTIKQRLPRCGEAGFSQCCTTDLGLDELPELVNHNGLDEQIASAQRTKVLAMLGEAMLVNQSVEGSQEKQRAKASSTEIKKSKEKNCPSNASTLFNTLQTQLNLSAQDQLILALTFEDGQSSRKVSDLLNVSPAFIQRRLKAIKQSCKQCLASMNISLDDISESQ